MHTHTRACINDRCVDLCCLLMINSRYEVVTGVIAASLRTRNNTKFMVICAIHR